MRETGRQRERKGREEEGKKGNASEEGNREERGIGIGGWANDSPCTRQTSLCTCASANFREFIVMGDDDDVEVGGERGACCTTVAIIGYLYDGAG